MGGKMSQAASVGFVIIVALVMAVVSIGLIRSEFFFRGKTYYVLVNFENAIGVSEGMPVKLRGADAGWVEKYDIRENETDLSNYTQIKIRIHQKVKLFKNDLFVTGQESLLGERVMMIQPAREHREEDQVKEGDVLLGEAQGDFTQLMAGAAKTVDSVNNLLSEDKLGGDLHGLITSMNGSMAQANLTMASIQQMLGSNQKDISGTMQNFRAMSANFLDMSKKFNLASGELSALATDPKNKEAAQAIRDNLSLMSEQMRILTEQMSTLSSDPQLQDNMKSSAQLARETMENMKLASGHFNDTLNRVDTLLDSSNSMVKSLDGAAKGASGLISSVGGTLGSVSSVGDSIDVQFNADARAVDTQNDNSLDEDDSYVGDINGAVGFGNGYVQVGADNLGEDSGWNFLMGVGKLRGGSFRAGAYRGEVGMGLRYGFGKQGDITTMLYDTHDPKWNAIGRFPVGDKLNLIVGAEDINQEAKGTVGVGVEF